MSEAKHTEGPWRVSSEIPTAIVADIPQAVDHKKYLGFDDPNSYGGYLIAESVVQPENARLIAAAPELLEALEALHSAVIRKVKLSSAKVNTKNPLFIKVTAAIAKATGGQQ